MFVMHSKTRLILTQYREGSDYADEIGRQYHFPRKYYGFFTLPEIEFIYYEPKRKGDGVYFGFGEIGSVTPDPKDPANFFAEIINYHPFKNPVSCQGQNGQSREIDLNTRAQMSVREIDSNLFNDLCKDGGLEIDSLGVESENSDSADAISNPFDPTKIKVDREPMSVFQVLRKIEFKEIILDPEFQRNLVWDLVRRSRLIESALLHLPLPAFYFDGNDTDKWTVVDGLQRLSTLRDFITKKDFRLTGLEYLGNIEGKSFNELPRGMQRQLEETQLMLFIIRPETPPEVKFTIFYRINTGGLVLTAQEIRHALFQGQATILLKALAESSEFKKATDWGVSDLRMDARECILRYIAFYLNPYTEYKRSDLNGFLSSTMKELNAMLPSSIEKLRGDFTKAMQLSHELLGRNAFRKFNLDSGRRGPVNKALFESWANVFPQYNEQELLIHKNSLQQKLGKVFWTDSDYARSLSAGTGSTTAVRNRFERAHSIVKNILSP
ncbi:DUF262 domain-containing protein [Opitutaceae bacterium TAV4]|nr:DUF262 domain-containing protein [Opitutaceae bacterium TAV4]RRK00195.1 DUF262 domain-containing protein [Opitutaceae bacterium TAV3]RRK01994.1 DUF262 domain-containing protein [Opitutaceae bacterium TAV3]